MYYRVQAGDGSRDSLAHVSAVATEIKIPGALMNAKFPLAIVLAGAGLEPVAKLLKEMFRKNGDRVFDTKNYRAEWYKACLSVGVGARDAADNYSGLRVRGLRCSAAKNIVDAGVPEDIVMKIGGWKTKATFSRYNVMNSERIRKAIESGGTYVAQRIAQA